MTTVSDIVRSARSLVGVRYQERGRSLDGIDCAGVVLLIAKKHKLARIAEPTDYRRAHTEQFVLDQMRRNFDTFKAVTACPGMVVALKPGRALVHLAVLDTMRTMIEACNKPGVLQVVRRPVPWNEVRGVFAFREVKY